MHSRRRSRGINCNSLWSFEAVLRLLRGCNQRFWGQRWGCCWKSFREIIVVQIAATSARGPFIYYVSTWRGRGGQKIVLFAYFQGMKYAYILAQSICTHYSCFENMGRFVTLKKLDPKYGLQMVGCKKQGHCYSKREIFSCPYSGLDFFKVPDPRKISGRLNELQIKVGVDWLDNWVG